MAYKKTMWWMFLFILVATAGASDDEYENPGCDSVFEECENRDEQPVELPGTEEELKKVCRYISKYLGCMNKNLENCDPGDNTARYIQEYTLTAERICDEDSLLYTAVVASLPCVKKFQFVTAMTCHGLDDAEGFNETLRGLGISLEGTDSNPLRCMRDLYHLGCFAARIGEVCHNIARDTIVDIMQGLDSYFDNCPPGAKENVLEIAKVLQMEAERENALENDISNDI